MLSEVVGWVVSLNLHVDVYILQYILKLENIDDRAVLVFPKSVPVDRCAEKNTLANFALGHRY